MGRAAALVALLSAASCVSSSSNVCDDGSLCPGGFVCDEPNHRCLLPEQIAECNGKAEAEACVFAGAPGACRDGACEPFFCGDGYVTAGEECEQQTLIPDDDPLAGKTCSDFGFYETDGLACTAACTYDLGDSLAGTGCYAHPYCGDHIVSHQELCDGEETRTCVSIGFDAGTTTCNLQCGFTITDCSRFGWNPESLNDLVAHAVAGTARDDQWAFGENGRAMRFEGAFWNTVSTGVQNTLINAWSFGPADAWAVGLSRSNPALPAVVIHWDGTLWSTLTGVPAAEDYLDVWGPSPTEVYVAADTGIFKYDGTSWTTVPGFTATPVAIRGTSGSDVWVTTKEGPLLHFNGTTWEDRTPDVDASTTAALRFLDVNAADDVWAIGAQSGIENSSNGVIAHYNGSTWQVWRAVHETYNAVASSGPSDTWVGGIDGIMRHWDGIAWSDSLNIGASPSGLTALTGLLSFGAGDVLGVSTQHLAYRYRGQSFGLFPQLGPNPFEATENLAVWSTAANDVYVVNAKGEVWHFDGNAWSVAFTTPGNVKLNDITGSAAGVWTVSLAGDAFHFDGSNWTPHSVLGVPLERVWVDRNGNDVWVFDSNGAYHKEGTSWPHTPLGAGRVASVSGSSPSNIWVVQVAPSSVWHYDGTEWSEVDTGSTFPELAVAAVAPDDVHVTAASGRFLRWDGTAWTETILPVLADMTFLAYTASDDVVAASERDLAHFNGRSWSTMRAPVDFVPNTMDYLPIVDLDVSPGRIDMLTERLRIRTLIRTRPLICRPAGDEDCSDGVDNDCDGKVDSADSDCP